MVTPSRPIRDLSHKLLTAEAKNRHADDPHEVVIVCEKLRVALTRLTGSDGFKVLVDRALSISRKDFPVLAGVDIGPDCTLSGMDELTKTGENEAAEAIIENLLSLLAIFIGRPMTMRLLRETWPDVM